MAKRKFSYKSKGGQFDYFCNKIDKGEPFAYVRYTHGLWDKIILSGVHEKITDIRNPKQLELAAKIYCDYKQKGGWIMTEDVMRQCFYYISHLDEFPDNLFFSLASVGSPHSESKKILNKKLELHSPVFDKFIVGEQEVYDGLIWKRAVLNNKFLKLINKIKDKNIILIAPEEVSYDKDKKYLMKNLGDRIGFKNFHFIEIHPKEASKQYKEIISKVSHLAKKIKGDKVFLFKAGPIGVSVITRLYGNVPECYMLDLGNALDIFSPGISRNWKDKNLQDINQVYSNIKSLEK